MMHEYWIGFCALLALTPAPAAKSDGSAPKFAVAEGAFPAPPLGDMTFLVVAADMDGDGDDDVLINKHNSAPLELWNNQGGSFTRLSQSASGIDDHPLIRSLYADESDIRVMIDERGVEGLYVWHTMDPRGPWRFLATRARGFTLSTNREVESVNVTGATYRRNENTLSLHPEPGASQIDLSLSIQGISQQLVVESDNLELPIFAGRELVHIGGRLDVWPPDPHGVAWWPSGGALDHDLFVGRGALKGTLARESDPKLNRAFKWEGGERLYRLLDGHFPADWGRARQVQWIDVDAVGRRELYIGNRTSDNALWSWDAEVGQYRDRAAEIGLDVFDGESFAWVDLDLDGREDVLLLAEQDAVRALRNTGNKFEPLDLEALGLDVEGERTIGAAKLFETDVLHVADFDNDGRLDLWIGGWGPRRAHRLFLRRDQGYENVTAAFGLQERTGRQRASDRTRATLLIDADNDSFLDVLALRSDDVLLYHNQEGVRFQELTLQLGPGPTGGTGCVLDANGDGREDFVVAQKEALHLCVNATENANRALRVVFESPTTNLGAVVTAHYSNGSSQAQRFGSARNAPYSQTGGALVFGVPAGVEIEALSVTRGGLERTILVEPGAGTITLAP